MVAIGKHVSRAKAVKTVKEKNLDTIQIFIGSPRSWNQHELSDKDAQTLKNLNKPIFVHSPYLFNPASANPEVREKTAAALQVQLDNIAKFEGEGLIVHAGQAGKDSTMEEALQRWREVLQQVELTAPIIIENTAGGVTAPGREIESFSQLINQFKNLPVEYCIDTNHAWNGGMGLENLYEKLLLKIGKPPIVTHLNGSSDPLHSGRDRHRNLVEGEEMTELSLFFAKEAGAPVILETPGEGAVDDLDLLRKILL